MHGKITYSLTKIRTPPCLRTTLARDVQLTYEYLQALELSIPPTPTSEFSSNLPQGTPSFLYTTVFRLLDVAASDSVVKKPAFLPYNIPCPLPPRDHKRE